LWIFIFIGFISVNENKEKCLARILETVNGSKGIFLARIREREFIMITEQGLKLELRKKFIGMEFKEIYKLEVRTSRQKIIERRSRQEDSKF
jgi:hypothetical protein